MLQRERPSAVAEIAPGSLVLLYTDGLIERRGEVIDVGVDRLKRALAASVDDLESALDAIIDAVAEDAVEDDIAALLMRVG
jgi:serine phosphatase RsbU (regulator of sigma subunit)